MICRSKRCGLEIPDDAVFCPYCGIAQRKNPKKLPKRKDGLLEKKLVIDGQRVSFYGKSEKEVSQKILDYAAKRDAAKVRGLQFDQVQDQWLDLHSSGLAYSTYKSYAAICRRLEEHFGQTQIAEITPLACQAFVTQLGRQGYAYKTVSNHLNVLRMVFDYAVLNGMAQFNPTTSVKLPRGLSSTPRLPVSSEICRLIDDAVDKPFGLLAYLVRYTGLRRGEALALQGKHFLFEDKLILVERSVYWQGNQPHIKLPKTKAGLRYAPLPDNVSVKIKPLRLKKEQLLFADENGFLLTESRLRDLWNQYLLSIGQAQYDPAIHDYRAGFQLHQLRHNYASDLYDLRIGDKEMEAFLGHSSASFTKRQYVALRNPAVRSAVAKINAFYAGV